jgi:hypothetical protein
LFFYAMNARVAVHQAEKLYAKNTAKNENSEKKDNGL